MFLWWPAKLLQVSWKFWFICHIHQTLHLQISIYFRLYKILVMAKYSVPWKTVKSSWKNYLLQKVKHFRKWIVKLPEKWQKIVEQMVNTLFNKVLDENEKCAFYFYLKKKKKQLFGQPNSCKTTTTVICIMFIFGQE